LSGLSSIFLVFKVHDVITTFKFGDDRFRGFWLAEGQSLPFPIDFEGRPYNTHTIVWGVIGRWQLPIGYQKIPCLYLQRFGRSLNAMLLPAAVTHARAPNYRIASVYSRIRYIATSPWRVWDCNHLGKSLSFRYPSRTPATDVGGTVRAPQQQLRFLFS